ARAGTSRWWAGGAVAAAARLRNLISNSHNLHVRIARGAGLVQPLQIFIPVLLLMLAQLVQVFPRVQAGVVAVAENELQRVVADRLDVGDRHVDLADLQRLLAGAVSAHFRRGRMNAQIFTTQQVMLIATVAQFERARLAMQFNRLRQRYLSVHGLLKIAERRRSPRS